MIQEKREKVRLTGKHARLFDAAKANPFRYKIAETLDDLLNAYRLVYHKYLARGYCKEKPSQIHFTRFCLFPESRTFIMTDTKNRQICGTASVIADSSCGLPMETSFLESIKKIRKPGRKLAEVTLLSIRGFSGETLFSRYKRNMPGVFNFFRTIFSYARHSGVTDLLAAVHPRHEAIYRYLTFRPVGAVVPYRAAQGNPASPMRLDLVAFCDPKLKNNSVQKYFLVSPKNLDFNQAPAHWDNRMRDYMNSCLVTP